MNCTMNRTANPWPEGKAIAVIKPSNRKIYGEFDREHILFRSPFECLDRVRREGEKPLLPPGTRPCDLADIEKAKDLISFHLYDDPFPFVKIVDCNKAEENLWLLPSMGYKNGLGDHAICGMLDHVSHMKWLPFFGLDPLTYHHFVTDKTIDRGIIRAGANETLRVAKLLPKEYRLIDRVIRRAKEARKAYRA